MSLRKAAGFYAKGHGRKGMNIIRFAFEEVISPNIREGEWKGPDGRQRDGSCSLIKRKSMFA